jgi:hypothetical protein
MKSDRNFLHGCVMAKAPEQAREVGDVFLAGYQFKERSVLEISRQFGDAFAYDFASRAESLGQWVGPVQSIFGSHWVWVDDIAESRVKSFAEVRAGFTPRYSTRSRRSGHPRLGGFDTAAV